ncbi:MAG: aldo/keto reductase [Acidobacteriota bacterium]|nr:aldo/keto reductase [Blastocatellia bacterium]MDW8413037.1 aldo/keto reductase [Acidobacteriota bacterium]
MGIPIRDYGTTGLRVPALGYGAERIGDPALDESFVGKFLNELLDLGVTLIDTARSYGLSEERIGRHISHRRHEFVLSTKVGYGVEGVPDWTYDAVVMGVEQALKRLNTDYIDIVHLHSCFQDTLERGEVIEALYKTVQDGKVRVAAYSGENEPLEWALRSARFQGLMFSVNVFDQRAIRRVLWPAKEKGTGIIAKRPMGNAPWMYKECPEGFYCAEYWHRMKAMGLDFAYDWPELALRFACFTYGVDSCVVGTLNMEHVKKNIQYISRGVLNEDTVNYIRDAFTRADRDWRGVV